jgi:two-component system, response regulator YesN
VTESALAYDQERAIRRLSAAYQKRLRANTNDRDVDCVLEYIHAHLYDEDLTVSRILEACHVRSNTFSIRFKKALAESGRSALSIRRYIEAMRVSAAMVLLQRPLFLITVIAICLGFTSHERFARSFRRRTGLTPGEYRKKVCQAGEKTT